jgi:indole-3-glycerol phosphate synthase
MRIPREGTVLGKIAKATLERIERAKIELPIERLQDEAKRKPPAIDFAAAFKSQGPHIIAEVKLRSPSEPQLSGDMNPLDVARSYANNGAAAISVLTEPQFFGGHLDHLSAIRQEVALPLLMKDFILDPYQFAQARAVGADAVLLIVTLLEERTRGMVEEAMRCGLSPLVEVHSEKELEVALHSGTRLIGINNRDLKTLEVNLGVSRRLAGRAKRNKAILITESGIHTREDIEELAELGYRGFLIGTSLLRTGDPGTALAKLLGNPARHT